MRQCPQCRTTYTDDTLRFCLSDGTPLVMMPGGTEAETVISYHPAKPVVVEIPQSTPAFAPPPSYQPPPVEKRGISPLAVGGIVALLVLVIAGLGAVLIYQNLSGKESANAVVTANTATPTPAASKTPTPEKSATPWNSNKTTPTPSPAGPPDRPSNDGVGVTVHSPGDGYLVLRSQPNSSSTEITRIPHGATIVLTACRDYTTTKSGNYGRWCTTGYSGYSGWVFDAFVRY